MDVNYSAKENAIRLAVRGWYDANPPIDLQAKVENNLRMNKADFLRRHKPVAMRGRVAPDRPVDCGGAGVTDELTRGYCFKRFKRQMMNDGCLGDSDHPAALAALAQAM